MAADEDDEGVSAGRGLGSGVSDAVLLGLLLSKRRAGELAVALRTRPFDPATLAGMRAFLAEDALFAEAAFTVLRSQPAQVCDRLANLGLHLDAGPGAEVRP